MRLARLAALAVAAGALLSAGCGREPVERRLVAIVVDLSGPGRLRGAQIRDGARLALREAQERARARTAGEGAAAAGRVEFLVQDDRGDPERASHLARILRGVPEVVAVIGPGDLPSAATALPEYGRDPGVPTLVPASVPPELTRDRPWIFAMAPAPDYLGETLAWFLVTELQVDSAATFFSRDPYGRSLERGFTAELERLGGGALARVPFDSTLARPELLAGAALDADALLVAAEEGLARRLVRALRAGGVLLPVLAGEAIGVEAAGGGPGRVPGEESAGAGGGKIASPNSARVFYPVLFDPASSPQASRFAESFARAFGRAPVAEAALAYDATALVLSTLEAGASGRDDLRERLAAVGTEAPYAGLTGSFFFTLEHDAVRDVTIAATGAPGVLATRQAGASPPAR